MREHMMRFCRSAVLAVALLICAGGAGAQPAYVPTPLDRQITPAWFEERWGDLEQLAASLRTPEQRTAGGEWLLKEFYRAFEQSHLGVDAVAEFPDGFAWGRLDRWSAAFPESPTPRLLRVIALVSLSRLSADARVYQQPLDSGWQPQIAYAEMAREELLANPAIGQQDPHYFVLLLRMLSAFRASPDDIILGHADAAARWPLYDELHAEALLRLAHPARFDGARLDAFANTVHAATRSAAGEQVYARMMIRAFESGFGHDLMSRLPVRWSRLRDGLRQIADRFPAEENRQRMALFACLAGDLPSAQAAFRETSPVAVRHVWLNPATHKACRTWSMP